MKKFYWDPDTLLHFATLKKTGTASQLERELWYFVSYNCSLEENETFKDLYTDLLTQVNNYENETI
jgi:hypothetical protein